MDEGHEAANGFIVAGGDTAALFEFCEESLNVVAFAVELSV